MGAAAVRACQLDSQPAAWVQYHDGGLYPPDLEEAGVDLDALIVVHVPSSIKLRPDGARPSRRDAPGPSTGPLVHTHVSAQRVRRPNGYAAAGRVLKRKGGGSQDGFEEHRRGPWGLV